MKIYQLLFILPFIFLANLNAQTKKQDLATAEKSMLSKNYFDALIKFKKLADAEPKNIEYAYKTAEAARLFSAYKIAIEQYTKVVEHKDNSKYPLANFYLGQVKQSQGDYDGARKSYTVYKSEHAGEDAYYGSLVEKEIKACEWATEQIKNPVKGTSVDRMGDNINSTFSDFAPSVRDGQFYFSSLRFDNTENKQLPKRHVSNILKSKDATEEAKKLEDEILKNPGKHIANSCFNAKKDKVYFTICTDINDVDKHCEIYRADVANDGTWTNLFKLPDYINLDKASQTQPSIGLNESTKNEILFFTSNRESGKGAYDIWYSVIEGDNFSEPINAKEINTAQDDITPYYHINSKTFFYSSKGHLGLGGFDIYSVKFNGGDWGEIKHMGSPLNSSYDDLYFIKTDGAKKAYFASNRTGAKYIDDINEACCLDIYQADIEPCEINLKALVFDAITQVNLNGATITLTEVKDPKSKPIVITKEDTNLFILPIECDKEYKIEATKPGYIPDQISFYSGKPGEFKEIVKKLYLKREPVKLDVLTFDKQTNENLNEATVSLIDLDDSLRSPVVITPIQSNLSQFELTPCHKYKIIATKKGYGQAEKIISIDCNAKGKIVEKLFLDKFLYSLLPVRLYFDNDRPMPNTMSEYCPLTYSQTYTSYYARKMTFIKNFAKIAENHISRAENSNAMESFFNDEVKGGKDTLEMFLAYLLTEMEKGKKYEIFLKGFASPLAKNEYNIQLGHRRIHAVQNEFLKYQKGVLKKYIKSGQLTITEKSFGEETAPKGIIDTHGDLRSIYTIEASKERRVEIIEIKE